MVTNILYCRIIHSVCFCKISINIFIKETIKTFLYVHYATIYKLQLQDITMVTGIYKQLHPPCYDRSITNLKNAICLRLAKIISKYSQQFAHEQEKD